MATLKPKERAFVIFPLDVALLSGTLALVGIVGSGPVFPSIWIPGVLLLAWSARVRHLERRGFLLDLVVGLLALPAAAILTKLDIESSQLLLVVAAALACALLLLPGIHTGLTRAPRATTTALGVVAVGFLLGFLHSRGVFEPTPPRLEPGTAKNLLMITVDTTRVDSVGCYGAPWDTTPALDALAKSGVVFEQAIAQAPHTHSSIASLLTSKYPIEHGSMRDYYHLDAEHLTLAEHMRSLGYRTAAFLDNPWLTSEFGFDQGYDDFVESAPVEDVLPWLKTSTDEPFFLHVHLLHPHGPYVAVQPFAKAFDPDYPAGAPFQDVVPIDVLQAAKTRPEAGVSESDVSRFRTLQASEIRAMDGEIAAVLELLDATQRTENTLVVVTADHGEEFLDHGSLGHAHTLYDELIHVPLIMRLPGVLPADTHVEAQIELVDVVPTILDLLGLPALDAARGSSFAMHLTEGAAPPASSEFAIAQLYSLRNRHLLAARTPSWKLLLSTMPPKGGARGDLRLARSLSDDLVWGEGVQLFDRRKDPGEQVDVSPAQPEVVDELLHLLVSWKAAHEEVH